MAIQPQPIAQQAAYGQFNQQLQNQYFTQDPNLAQRQQQMHDQQQQMIRESEFSEEDLDSMQKPTIEPTSDSAVYAYSRISASPSQMMQRAPSLGAARQQQQAPSPFQMGSFLG